MLPKISSENKKSISGKRRVCDILIKNAYVITMDRNRNIYPSGAIAIDNDIITAVGSERGIISKFKTGRIIDAGGAPVHPGFIDAHYHTSIHLARGVISENPSAKNKISYFDWFNALEDEDEYNSALASCVEMVRNGYTTFMEPGTVFEPSTVAEAAEAIGMRVSLSDPFIWDTKPESLKNLPIIKRAPFNKKRAFKKIGQQLKRNASKNPLVTAHICLYGCNSASEELLIAANEIAKKSDVILNTHHNFTPEEAESDDSRFGKMHNLLYLDKLGILTGRSTFVHMNVIRDDEMQPIIDSGMSIVWVPGNFQFYSLGLKVRSRMAELLNQRTNVTLGVDTAKIWTFGEMELLAYLIARQNGEYISPEKIFEMRTIGASQALGLGKNIGSIEQHKKADLIIRTNKLPEAQPGANIIQEMMLVSRSKSVDTVIVNGQIIYRKGEFTRVDQDLIYEFARHTSRRIMKKIKYEPKMKWPLKKKII